MLTKYSALSKDIVRRNISMLVNAGFVDMNSFGIIKIYSLNKNNSIVNDLVEFLIKTKIVKV